MSAGMRLVSTGSWLAHSVFIPKRSACAASSAEPRSRPSWANVVLQLTAIARTRLSGWPALHRPPPKLPMLAVVRGSSWRCGSGKIRSGVAMPVSRAAAAVTTLNVEPGGYHSRSARLRRGRVGSSSSRSQAARTAAPSWRDSSVGS
jgi:hypothetical protein